MSTLKTPFIYDFVGSFLRPQALKEAKTKYQNNDITKDEYDSSKTKRTRLPRNY